MSIFDFLEKNNDINNILPTPMEAQEAINFLSDYLLGEEWYVINSINSKQVNTEIVFAILEKYSKKFKKEKKRWNK